MKCKVLRVVQTVDSIRKKEPLPFKYGLPLLFPCNTEMYIPSTLTFKLCQPYCSQETRSRLYLGRLYVCLLS